MTEHSPKLLVISGYRLSSQAVSAVVETSLLAKVALYRIPAARWFNWLAYRTKRFGLLALIGHIELSLYLRLRAKLMQFGKQARQITDHYEIPTHARRLTSGRSVLSEVKNANIVVLMEPFRLPRSLYKTAVFLEVVWGSVPEYMGDSAGWWQKVAGNMSTSVSVIQRSGEASDITLLASWEVQLAFSDTIGRVRLRQADVLIKQLPKFLKHYAATSGRKSKPGIKRQFGYSYISPTLREYLKYNQVSSIPEKVINRRRTRINYKIRAYEEK